MKIGIIYSERNFEYDVYHLVRAFYPGSEIITAIGTAQESPDADLSLRIDYGEDRAGVSIRNASGILFQEDVRLLRPEDRPTTKNQLKRLVYSGLERVSGHGLPWGDLTGIRPVKNVIRLFRTLQTEPDVRKYLTEVYRMSPEKTDLAVGIAKRQMRILEQRDFADGYSLYIDIPFCPSICLYCTFGSHPIGQWGFAAEEYLRNLKEELRFISEAMRGIRLDSVYIGGGTPTSISAEQMDSLLDFLERTFPLEEAMEFTVEAGRPDTCTPEKLQVLKNHPVTRISINPQTMQDKTLKVIGRNHTARQTREAFDLARKTGFGNINMDLIVGLPGEGKSEVSDTLRQIREMAPESITVHSLALKRAARLNLFREEYADSSFQNSDTIMHLTEASAKSLGMRPYYLYRQKNIAGNFENTGYAKPGFECLYNILMMEECQSILAAGCRGSSKLLRREKDGGVRVVHVENVKDLVHYNTRIEEMIARKRNALRTH